MVVKWRIAVPGAGADNSAVGTGQVTSEGEGFRRAVAWLLQQPDRSWATLEQASQQFGLSPLESAVLFRYFSSGDPVYISKDHQVTGLK